MKKLLLGLGSIAAVAAPIAAVVSCGDDDGDKNGKNIVSDITIDSLKGTISSKDASVTGATTIEGIDTIKAVSLKMQLGNLVKTGVATFNGTTRTYFTIASNTQLDKLTGKTSLKANIGEADTVWQPTFVSVATGTILAAQYYMDTIAGEKDHAFGKLTATEITYLFTLTTT
ncbi:MAG: hypothetical protein KAG91_01525 [Mycoplasmataceae bacterium]|nr:hypothetical protein [Mycoplasmataceae bacterium]